jgi:hypothetical protein
MLIVRLNERKAMPAGFTACRDRLFGGQYHRVSRVSVSRGNIKLWAAAGSIPNKFSSQGTEPSDWRGS